MNQPITALEFLRRAADGKYRIVSSGDLHVMQISEAQAEGKFFVDDQTGLGWALLPWELTTDKDRHRERGFFTRQGIECNTTQNTSDTQTTKPNYKTLTECVAQRDGECNHLNCPQLRNRQSHCPLDKNDPTITFITR